MCRYCKNLKRLKDLDEKGYKKIINKWRNYAKRQDKLLSEALDILDFYAANGYLPNSKSVDISDLCWRIKYFFQKDWI